jgi:ribosomal-protein-alanine N-acetyltransferase
MSRQSSSTIPARSSSPAAADGSVVGRFNLIFEGADEAVLGYRVAEEVAGRGVATAAVRDLCRLARDVHGVHTVHASTSDANLASQRVLTKAGFVPVGPANPKDVGGKTGTTYQLVLEGSGR